MSSQQPAGKEKKGLSRVLSKLKLTSWRKADSSAKRQSTATAPTTSRPVAAAVIVPGSTTPGTRNEVAVIHVPVVQPPKWKSRYEGMPGVSKLSKAELHDQRAKSFHERYGINVSPSSFQIPVTNDTVLRVDKPIRMRVRRTCHLCQTSFNSARQCPQCAHTRCDSCTRHPPKRTQAEIIANRDRRAALIRAQRDSAPISIDHDWATNDMPVLKRPNRGGQDLVHKKPRQRVRRTCHVCTTLFIAGSKKCDRCNHARCTDCPRDPPKLDKYPFGYPGDEFGPNSIPHFECERCQTIYPTNAEDGVECRKCQHPKSMASPRALPRKVEPIPDPEVLRQIQIKLDNLQLTPPHHDLP